MNVRVLLPAVLQLACLAGVAAGQAVAPRAAARVASVQDTVLVLADGRRYVPGLYRLHHHFTVLAPSGQVYLVLSGFECFACDAARVVVLLEPGRRVDWRDAALVGFAYPGTQFGVDDSLPYSDTRLFFGRCLDQTSGLAQFAHERSGSQYVDSLRTTVFTGGQLSVRSYLRTQSLSSRLLRQVRRGQCVELLPRLEQVTP